MRKTLVAAIKKMGYVTNRLSSVIVSVSFNAFNDRLERHAQI